MKLNLLFLAVSIICLLKMPTGLGLLLDTFLYSSWIWYQFCFSTVATQNTLIFASYGILSILYFIFNWVDVLPVTGIVVYSAFALNYLASVFQAKQVENRNESLVCLVLSILAIFFSFALRPSPSYIFVPLFLFSGEILLQKILRRKRRKRRKKSACARDFEDAYDYDYGSVRVTRVTHQEQQQHCEKILEESYRDIYLDMLQKSQIPSLKGLNLEQFQEVVLGKVSPAEKDRDFRRTFLVEKKQKDGTFSPVGTFQLTLSLTGEQLPLEKDVGLSLGGARREFGRMSEVGRFAILALYRQDPLLIDSIFRSIVHEMIKNRVAVLFCQGLPSTRLLYRKIGFKPYTSDSHKWIDAEFGLPVEVLVLNVAAKMKEVLESRKHTQSSGKSQLREDFQGYLKDLQVRCPGILERTPEYSE